MFTLADDSEIGRYLHGLYTNKYGSARQFGIACLKEANRAADDASVQAMSIHLSEIKLGKTSVQLQDLPIFSKLLGVSCEEILSAGKSFVPISDRLTNYSVAFSKDPQVWEAYINQKEQIILNADEYGKTVIDYALAFDNYEFLKYLMDNDYIWFVSADEKERDYKFGAGTSIKRNPYPPENFDKFTRDMLMNEELRTSMIRLAIKRGDVEMLERLHARELSQLYSEEKYYNRVPDYDEDYRDKLLNLLPSACYEVLEYFLQEFEITNNSSEKNKFMFPYIGELTEELIRRKNAYAEYFLKAILEHNRRTLSMLMEFISGEEIRQKEKYYQNYDMGFIDNIIKQDVHFDGKTRIIKAFSSTASDGFVTNIARVNAASENHRMSHMIQDINDLYKEITVYADECERR